MGGIFSQGAPPPQAAQVAGTPAPPPAPGTFQNAPPSGGDLEDVAKMYGGYQRQRMTAVPSLLG